MRCVVGAFRVPPHVRLVFWCFLPPPFDVFFFDFSLVPVVFAAFRGLLFCSLLFCFVLFSLFSLFSLLSLCLRSFLTGSAAQAARTSQYIYIYIYIYMLFVCFYTVCTISSKSPIAGNVPVTPQMILRGSRCICLLSRQASTGEGYYPAHRADNGC